MLNINKFIDENITCRQTSLFLNDIKKYAGDLFDIVHDKTILVIGGAGSIGSSFIRAILAYKPSKLVVVDISENGLTELTRDLRSSFDQFVPDDYRTYALSFADPLFVKLFCNEGGFDIVANFSAHKHVRSEKDVYSVQALLENNVLRARCFLELLREFPPHRFFCVSTDKAANPVNVMGGSKKMMENMIMAYSSEFNVSTARFANVAFSNGSLLDGFIQRMMKRQPLTAPSDVKRYFVSPEESGQICMLACLLGKTREIFFPKLQEEQMMTFSEICDRFLNSLGYKIRYCDSAEEAKIFAAHLAAESKEWPVYYFTSDTTGEKAFEEFCVAGEKCNLERFESLGVIENVPASSLHTIQTMCDEFELLFARKTLAKTDVVNLIKKYIPNFEHEEKGKNLDQKM